MLRIISDCEVDQVSAILAFTRAGQIDRTAPKSPDWFLYDFTAATLISVSEWNAASYKKGPRGETVVNVLYPRATSRYVEFFRGD